MFNQVSLVIVICIVVLLALVVSFALVFPSVNAMLRDRKNKKIVDRAVDQFKITFRITVYRIHRGAMVQTLWRKDVDSIFKVAQYAPPNFEEFTTRWQPVAASYNNEIVRSYERYYVGDDGNHYAIVVYPDIGEWPVSAAAYLNYL